ncbi:hypothetical protein [Pseudoalteromonas sp. MEBiC 03485]|uniref:hypothetical protein n=1 Tax=Pseudoalteromonas sp. MEBiC 03485 TaxID=2571103 RepID=UPI00101F1DEF|nr:hypothetical protein [Pseudoalteromonas sp. MEBiC 03485]RZD19628.1 hypothetical protein EVU92_20725 [Pseudoalteromonas sp. MEBiC 03485]
MKLAYKKNIFESIASNFDWLFQRVNDSFLHVNPRSFIDIVTTEGKNTLVMRDGTLLTAIKVHGSTRDIRYEEYVDILDSLESSFKSLILSEDHFFSWTFKSDPENVDEALEKAWTSQALETAKKLELDLEDIIKEIHDVHAKKCQEESVYLLVWTNVHMSTRNEKKLHAERRNEFMAGTPRHNKAQPVTFVAPDFYEKHLAACEQLVSDLLNVRIYSSISDSHSFLRDIRINIDETFTPQDWSPRVPGDPVSLKILSDNDADLSGMFHQPIADQLMPRGMVDHEEGIVRSGDVFYAPLSMETHPKQPEPFDALFGSVYKSRLPFRMHMLMKHNGMGVFGMKVMLAQFLSFTGSESNKRLRQCYYDLEALSLAGEEIVSSQISFCTWSRNVDDFREIRQRKHSLARKISSWGSCDVAAVEGDEAESMLSSIGGTMLGSVADAAAAPLYDSLKMAPIARMGSAWEKGSKLYRTNTGRIVSYMPYSKQQLAWVKFIVGPMGSGKTVHLNGEHFSLLLHPDNDELPFILNIDIGPGMKGFCSMVRDALPKHRKHEVVYEKLQNRAESAINSFDTPIGLRYPLSNQVAYLETFLTMLCIGDDSGVAPEGVGDVITQVIQLVYKYRADRNTSYEYRPNVSPRVDELLEALDIESANIDNRVIKWWDVVDFLAKHGELHGAAIAQRYAVPVMEDVISIISDPRIANSFEELTVKSTGEKMCRYIERKLTSSLNKYPILSGVTKFDIGSSRIVSLDLDEVGKGVGESAVRRLRLMYFLAYFTLTKRIFTGKEHLSEMQSDNSGLFPFDYTAIHTKLIASIERTPKRFSGDEMHRFKGDPMAMQLQELSIREGRKWKVDVILASQRGTDFPKDMIELATDVVILGRGNEANIASLTNHFKLPSNLVERLRSSMRRPNKDGSTVITLIETDKARWELFLYSMYGPSFLWATTSTRDDTIVKDALIEKLGSQTARQLLVELYPSGNLDDEIDDRRRREQVLSNASIPDEQEETPVHILDGIIEDSLRHFERQAMH